VVGAGGKDRFEAPYMGEGGRMKLRDVGCRLAILNVLLQAFGNVLYAEPGQPLIDSYSFVSIDIPISDGQVGFTHFTDINKNGKVTGGFTNSILGPYGFVLSKKLKKSTEIRCSGEVVETAPQSINKRGEVVGFSIVHIDRVSNPQPSAENSSTKISGFFLNKKGECTILDFPGAILTEAVGVNDDGQVVGDYMDTTGNFHGFVWANGIFSTFDVPFPEATTTAPSAINNVGQIVGFYFDDNGRVHGFLYDTGHFTSFDFPDATATLPSDINDAGQIVGIYADVDSVAHSFLLDEGEFETFVVPFPDAVATDVSGINNRGQIVGRYITSNEEDPVNPFLSHGFVATPNKKSRAVVMLQRP
jgi:probable HAF family extracellular repeat protein